MGFIKLEPRCPKRSELVHSVDPEPNWTMDELFSELKYIESKLGSDGMPSPLKKLPKSWNYSKVEEVVDSVSKPFIMRIPDDEEVTSGSEDEVIQDSNSATGFHFSFTDIDVSDSEEDDDELHVNTTQGTLIHRQSLEEDILFELEREHQLKVKEQLRNTLSAIKFRQQKERERSLLNRIQLEKQLEERWEMDRKVDKQYQRKIAEVLDSSLSALQRDHEKRSQIVERSIRDEAIEEAKRRQKALYDEKLRQEKAKADEEARQKAAKIAEEQKLALEAARREAEEVARKEYQKADEEAALKAASQKVDAGAEQETERQKGDSSSGERGIRVLAANAALKAESNRMRIYNDVEREATNISHKDIERYGRRIFKIINQISGTFDDVRSKAHDLINTIGASGFPQPISILIFAQKVVSLCENPRGSSGRTVFACARVVILISSRVPGIMDFVVAELNKACIYTVPKHLHPSNHVAQNEDYWKMVGYREEGNKMESSDNYFSRMRAYISLYAALIQTEIEGIKNHHGLQHGWAWLAMFLNSLPSNRYTAVALDSFLRIAGFALYRQYKSQFLKILDVVSHNFLPRLKGREDHKLEEIIHRLDEYLSNRRYREEPEGWRLEDSHLLSGVLV